MRLACHFERQFMAFLGLIAMILPAAAQPVVISVTGGSGVAISPQLYGINYVWDKVPGAEFGSFLSSLTRVSHYTMARYPGGWNAERLDWAHNIETREAPSQPGIDAADFLASVPLATFITPSHTAVSHPQNIGQVVNRSVRLVEQYGAQVPAWEIGNEWWLQTGASKNSNKYAINLENYGLLLGAVVPAMKAANPSIKIYATGDCKSTVYRYIFIAACSIRRPCAPISDQAWRRSARSPASRQSTCPNGRRLHGRTRAIPGSEMPPIQWA
jgi:hypothetical protein